MTNIYCGANKVPKNKKLGSMSECAKKGQIRLYGLKKTDPITFKYIKEEKAKAVKAVKDKERERYNKIIAKIKKDIEKKKEVIKKENIILKKKIKEEEKLKDEFFGKGYFKDNDDYNYNYNNSDSDSEN